MCVVLDELEYWWLRAKLASRCGLPLRVTCKEFGRLRVLKERAGLWLWLDEVDAFMGVAVVVVEDV